MTCEKSSLIFFLLFSFYSLNPWPLEALPCVVGILSGSGLYQLSRFTLLHGNSKWVLG